MAWRVDEEAQRARVVALVRAGGHDAALHRRIPLTREQVRYILALLETRTARRYGPEAVAGALARMAALEAALTPDTGHSDPESGLDHLQDFLGDVYAESDGHGLWDVAE
jgi:hypothetical protein